MSRTRPMIAGLVVASVVGLVITAVATGSLRRVLGGGAATTADVTPALPAEAPGGAPPSDAPAADDSPDVGSGSADRPTGAAGAPEVFDTATVSLTDDDGGTAMFTLSNAAPGAGDTGCITVTYTGDSDATVRLYGTTGGTGLAGFLGLTITRGTFPSGAPAFDSCAGFVPDAPDYLGAGAGIVYDGTLDAYPDDYDAGLTDPPGAPEAWTDAETHAYRFAVTVADDNGAQGLAASQTFTWEARGEDPLTPSGPVPFVDPTSGGPGTVVTVGSGTDPCVPPSGTANPTARIWITSPAGDVLHEVFLAVAADGSWSGTITIPESAAPFDFVNLLASCADGPGTSAEASAAAAPYHLYSAVRFTITHATPAAPGTPTTPTTPAEPASPVGANPSFVG